MLGRLSVDGDRAGLGSRDRVVLAALALRPGEVVSTERLADALWGERPPMLGDAQALVAAAPLREDRWALLALAQYRSGRPGDTLRTLHQVRSVLAR